MPAQKKATSSTNIGHDVLANDETAASDACENEWRRYSKLFPSVEYMTSRELQGKLLQDDSSATNEKNIKLVDCRTRAEQKVSMLPGAIALDEWEERDLSKISKEEDLASTKVVMYCTIGYRSAVEATRLKELHPLIDVVSLDGIVPYTHYSQAHEKPFIQKRNDGTIVSTNRVHVYGPAWKRFANPEFESVVFSSFEMLVQGVTKKIEELKEKWARK